MKKDCNIQLNALAHHNRVRCLECVKARDAVAQLAKKLMVKAINDGRIKKQSCAICGDEAEAHHDDYGRPIKVRWLCRSHHRLHHAQEDRISINYSTEESAQS